MIGEAIQAPKPALSSHTAWVSSVAWCPSSSNHIVSGSHDGTVRVWDIRSTSSLFVAGTHEGKVLGVAYAGPNRIVSGANPCCVPAPSHTQSVRCVTVHVLCVLLLCSGGADCEVKVFEQEAFPETTE